MSIYKLNPDRRTCWQSRYLHCLATSVDIVVCAEETHAKEVEARRGAGHTEQERRWLWLAAKRYN